jgi:hypothetical protein
VEGQCACTAGLTACKDATLGAATLCVDTAVNTAHCGRCFNRCKRDEVCIKGNCNCPTGWSLCQWGKNSAGKCCDTTNSDSHCGRCWHRCETRSALQANAPMCARLMLPSSATLPSQASLAHQCASTQPRMTTTVAHASICAHATSTA